MAAFLVHRLQAQEFNGYLGGKSLASTSVVYKQVLENSFCDCHVVPALRDAIGDTGIGVAKLERTRWQWKLASP